MIHRGPRVAIGESEGTCKKKLSIVAIREADCVCSQSEQNGEGEGEFAKRTSAGATRLLQPHTPTPESVLKIIGA